MSDQETFLDKVGWFIGYNAARVWGWVEDAYAATKHFILGIPDSIRLFFLRF